MTTTSVTTTSASTTSSTITSAPSTSSGSDGAKRSHHAKVVCPVCNKVEGNLRRHLQSHARKGLIAPDAVETILSVSRKRGKRRGHSRKTNETVRKGIPMKWCPDPDCEYVTQHLRSHLTHKHRVKPGTFLDNYLRVAERYRGQQEVDEVSSYIRRHGSSQARIDTSSTTTSSTTDAPALSASESPDRASTSSRAGARDREPREKDLPTDHCTSDSNADDYIPSSAEADKDSGESSGESSNPESVQSYFSAATPSNDRHWWLLEFFK